MGRLSQQVGAASAGFGSGLAVGISGAADAMRLLGGAAQAVGGVVGAVADQFKQGFASNTEIERATIAFQRFTGSAEGAQEILSALRREAAVSPFNDQEVIAAGKALMTSAQGSTEALLELVRVSEQLATLDPLQGLAGGAFALQEALSGDFQSFIDRFEVSRAMIQRLRDEGVPNLEIVKQALAFKGIDTGAIEAFGRSFEGRLSTILSFGQELRGLVTSGVFRAVGEAFGHMVELITRYGDQLRQIAGAVGEVFATLGQRLVRGLEPVLGLLDLIAPGLREAVSAEFARPIEAAGDAAATAAPQVAQLQAVLTLPQARQALQQAGTDLERLQSLAARTAAPVAVINRELGDIGVRAAEIQLGADRIRRGFEDQVKPLERQLELLQNSAEVQRIQNALASNRAISERLRLERELQALQAAGGDVDPAAADLTPRQRAIALATQERRLQLEALDLQRQQGPAVQTLQERIADLRRREQEALDPSERLLALYKDRVGVLQVESQRWQNLKGDIDAAAAAAQTAQVAAPKVGPDDATHAQNVQTATARAQELATAWLDGFQQYVDANGGSAWTAIGKSLTDWSLATGIPTATRVGGELGKGIGEAIRPGIVAALEAEKEKINQDVARILRAPIIEGIVRGLIPGLTPLLSPEVRARVGENIGARVSPGEPGVEGGAGPTVNMGPVTVNGVQDPGLGERLRQALVDFISTFILTGMGTDAGAQTPLAGNAR